MTLSQIEHFIRTAELLNFSKAAEALFMSQPALSKEISRLEKDLGFPLFIRDTRNVELTQAGLLYYKGVVEMMAQYNALTEEALELSKKGRQTVVIGGHLANLKMLVVAEGAKGLVNTQNRSFEAIINKSNQSLTSNWFDPALAITEGLLGDNDIELLFDCPGMQESELESTFLYRDQLVIYSADTNHFSSGDEVRYTDLEDYYIPLAAASNLDFNTALLQTCQQAGFVPKTKRKLFETMADLVSQCAPDELIVISESMSSLIPRPDLVGLVELNLAEEFNFVNVVAVYRKEPPYEVTTCVDALVEVSAE